MALVDVIIKLKDENIIAGIKWFNENLQKLFESIWKRRIGQPLQNVFTGFDPDSTNGDMVWEDNHFIYTIVGSKVSPTILMKLDLDSEDFLKAALNLVDEGVQIYDKNAYAVFMNDRSRRISEIPDNVSVEGRHLLDMYPLDENVSTTLTSLRTERPVVNRVDHYNTSDGAFVAAAYTAIPIRKYGEVIGTVVFEQNSEVVEEHIKRMKSIQKALDSYVDPNPRMPFTGYTFDNIIGNGAALEEAVSIAKRVSAQDCSVLLIGETGTGKELFAQSIHRESGRRDGKFLAINCAAVPENLIEGVLFGTVKGSFTGSEDRVGYMEEASGGTLFLDELNSMSLAMQSKILRAVQERTIRRVGGSEDISIDVRIISSCNEDPFKAIRENRLRRDLFYRLSTVMINLPPLRDHPEDIETLMRARIRNSNMHYVNKVDKISPEVLEFLKNYSWPGNVRELFHLVDYAMNVTDGGTIKMEHLPKHMTDGSSPTADAAASAKRKESDGEFFAPDWSKETLQSVMDRYENEVLRQALDQYGGNISRTAAALDIKRQSLQYRINKYGIIV
ncbi:MAG: sigma 54-interacting transcriptional regulator [Firmicutes bacterium]|nr:sigma 54-interacting transcriptional regulator [Bacillota bacterium]